ncbi:serine/threonine-protein kinase RIM15-like [Chenopodium quinoa]|uniref:serine/threonine-protein kinase RIM15-like n=1 Tax=Chenopodium quinoa TaxID=63459 RepID=UPI000B794007|nr:serine/threonine-protein kinase RIM15-like [Chenopodium quinoa]
MKTQFSSSNSSSSSDIAICRNYNYIEKAWHLVSILLLLGRPASPEELSGRCSLFRTTPEFVHYLCSIPNSPLNLISRNFVGLKMSVFIAFGEFFARSMPKIELRVFGGERLFRGRSDVARMYFRKRKKSENEIMPIMKKRAVLRSIDENVMEMACSSSNQKLVTACCEGIDLPRYHPSVSFNAPSIIRFPKEANSVIIPDMVATTSMMKSSIKLLEYQLNIDDQESGKGLNTYAVNDMDTCVAMEKDSHYTNEPNQHDKNSLVKPMPAINTAYDFSHSKKCETKMLDLNEEPLMDDNSPEEKVENIMLGSCTEVFSSVDKLRELDMEIVDFKEEVANIKLASLPLVSAGPQSSSHKSPTKSLMLKDVPQVELTEKLQTPSKLVQHNKVDIIHKEQRGQKGQNHRIIMAMMDKSKPIARNNASIQKRCDDVHKSSKDQQKLKFPAFKPYTVEAEEGSGGYGTVYRARRNSDGSVFAIKCPHENAHKHHLKNELRMLERFGGKNYVIKYECSLKSDSSDCFVLEHVEHDRPEVLRKEINIFQLQLYGYCMFKALVSLHKQGVFHRDIKPGNFLFSRKTLKGYLIDFNLAKDLNQKHGNIEKSQPCNVADNQQFPSAHFNSTSPNKRKKILGGKSSELFKAGAESGANRSLETKALKKKDLGKFKGFEDIGRCTSLTSQGAEGSGITSTRDMTSTRAPSAERQRKPQPLFSKGRKELISLAQKAMQGPNLGAAKAPASNRKRVAASPGITDRKFIHPTPAPIHSSGIAIPGAGSLKNRGEVKPVKDGPSAGTKGFRAPEVLLRSAHQGPKVDVWSAGVTLLYLISGRMPFNGDLEQNMKDIVNMKGNEELWEVAKLHNREASFPAELLDIRYLQSITIKDWFMTNTKRQDLLKVIPDSLFDLLDKCLTVNPRLRITADEALNHEFFAPVQDALLKRRTIRRSQNEDSNSNLLPLLCEPVRQEKLNAPVKV